MSLSQVQHSANQFGFREEMAHEGTSFPRVSPSAASISNECLPERTQPVADEPPLSFERIVDTHYMSLYRFAMSMCKREAMAKDLVQQTFLLWAKKGHSLRDTTKVKTWLFTTIYREYLGIVRREKRHRHVEFHPDLHGVTQSGDDPMLPRVGDATLQHALDQLAPNYRAALVLFYLKELSYNEISVTLNIPMGTVMSRISRAKAALRLILIRLEEDAVLEFV